MNYEEVLCDWLESGPTEEEPVWEGHAKFKLWREGLSYTVKHHFLQYLWPTQYLPKIYLNILRGILGSEIYA